MDSVATTTASFSSPLQFLWGVGAAIVMFCITVFWGVVCILLTLITRQSWPPDVIGRIWCRWILTLCGIHVDLEGAEHIDRRRSYVIISNHLSNFDIWTTVACVPAKVRFVAKKELLRFPIFGQALALSDHIIIDRSKPEEAVEIINRQARERIGEGFCILFYAEGTRSRDGKIHEFKKGGAALALRAGLPIIPMSVSGTRKFLPRGSAIFRPGGRVKIVIGEPIETAGLGIAARDELTERVRDIVVKNYIEDY
ncbi:MAG TPA: lysophospholipid acyltransferase family protein [Candidatus Binatia bacterium]|nr:lysophospholipid acyltransferase family protein [Candidatus Binatia bacterium]